DENNKGVAAGTPWQKGPIPLEYAIIGLGPSFIRIEQFDYFKEMLEKVFKFTEVANEGAFHLFEVGEGGNGAAIIVKHNEELSSAQQGYGTVHHLAFRVADRVEIDAWNERLTSFGFGTSGHVDRFFFESLYVKVAP